MASLFSALGGPTANVDVNLSNEEERKHVEVKLSDAASGKEDASGRKDSVPIYYDGETVSGTAVVR